MKGYALEDKTLTSNRFQRSCHVQPDHVQLDLEIFGKLTAEIGDCIRKHPLHAMPQGLGILCKACLVLQYFEWGSVY